MKRNYWPLFFIGIFSFTMYMIGWTIYSASNTPVHNDESFLSTYADVDENFNNIISSNKEFLKSYQISFEINKRVVDLTIDDVFLSQRAIEKRVEEKSFLHSNMLNHGKNSINVIIKDMSGKAVSGADVQLKVTRPTNNKSNTLLNNFTFKDGVYTQSFELDLEGFWNITGVVKINDKKAYLFIKTDASK